MNDEIGLWLIIVGLAWVVERVYEFFKRREARWMDKINNRQS